MFRAGIEDSAGAGLNGILAGEIVYVEDLTATDPALQALIDSNLSGYIHGVSSYSGNEIVLSTTADAGVPGTVQVAGGSIHRVRPNRSDTYPAQVYDDDTYSRPDDPDSLTVWTVLLPLDPENCIIDCYPAWVANRLPDFGDAAETAAIKLALGVFILVLAVYAAYEAATTLAVLDVERALANYLISHGEAKLREIRANPATRHKLENLSSFLPENPSKPTVSRLFAHVLDEARDREFGTSANLAQMYRAGLISRFDPATRDDRPIPAALLVPFRFTLN